MTDNTNLEVWLRGPLPDLPALLQPVAHALLEAREEINILLQNFPDHLLWEKPAGVASVAFHLQHLTGVLDRLFTYARAEILNEQQLIYLAAEGKYVKAIKTTDLVQNFNNQIKMALTQIILTDTSTLTEIRAVGRNMIPSTHIGLLFHAAEHTMRHLGQLLVTVKILHPSA